MSVINRNKLASVASEFVTTRLMPTASPQTKGYLSVGLFFLPSYIDKKMEESAVGLKTIGILNETGDKLDIEKTTGAIRAYFNGTDKFLLQLPLIGPISLDAQEGEALIELINKYKEL